jgi:hypothetical protein
MAFPLLQVEELLAFHDASVAHQEWPAQVVGISDDLATISAIADNHRFNCLLWAEEDLARRTGVDDALIAANKRAIDGFNQQRNDATERIDEALLRLIGMPPYPDDAEQSSETAGAMIDRLSILSLKIYHMGLQGARTDASEEHRARCIDKEKLLALQRNDLARALTRLLKRCQDGTGYFKIYRQFKMYNDPTLNPQLYGAESRS